MSSWDSLGDVASVAQLTGINAVQLISMIVKAANTARMHKKNCKQFAQHLKLIGNLLDQLKISELKKYPETREPLEQLEDSLRKSYILINSCQDRSYLYLLAMGWNVVYQFRKAQSEIDRYLRLVPLINLVDNARVRERLDDIEKHQCEYTFEEDDRRIQDVILKPESIKNDATILKKTLSRSYPNLGLHDALQKENEKLQLELQISQSNMDVGQCQIIERLFDITEALSANYFIEKDLQRGIPTQHEYNYSDANGETTHAYDGNFHKNRDGIMTRKGSSVSSRHDLLSSNCQHEEWHADLFGCCSQPYLCMKTFFCPCWTLSKVASVATNRHVSSADACNELMAYSLVFSCCCYTCCFRRKLRSMLNIKGGLIDDFLSHFLCCCCALVQEWREVEMRCGPENTKTIPPPLQYMES
ncbi:hypothetical protein IC582_018534 [Cucumis melo]|uniref:Protein MID1-COMPLEMENTING ACTIVITY 1 n=1 Tax=Cucumis melo TaxID=3656 RepID=A0ABM3L4D8_CUCME|nr:protein MID1-COMPLEMENTING ACTIVITY 1 [Cucumis melo]XP_050944899.1 protein MID1-COMPLEMENTING ACTIVITY 1 [Cucumis melo]